MRRIYSIKEVCFLTSLSRTTIAREEEEGRFPESVPLGERRMSKPRKRKDGTIGPPQLTGRIGYDSDLVDGWIADRLKKRTP